MYHYVGRYCGIIGGRYVYNGYNYTVTIIYTVNSQYLPYKAWFTILADATYALFTMHIPYFHTEKSPALVCIVNRA